MPAVSGAPAGARQVGPQAQIATELVTEDPEAQRGTQIVDLSLPPMVKQARREEEKRKAAPATGAAAKREAGGPLAVEESNVSRGVDDVLSSARLLYARMHRLDRWTLWAALLALVASFLPWSTVLGEGLLAGIQEYGAASAGGAVLLLFLLYRRTSRRRLAGTLLGLQVLVAAVPVAAPVYRFLTATDTQFTVGIFLTAAAGLATVVLTLARLTRLNA